MGFIEVQSLGVIPLTTPCLPNWTFVKNSTSSKLRQSACNVTVERIILRPCRRERMKAPGEIEVWGRPSSRVEWQFRTGGRNKIRRC